MDQNREKITIMKFFFIKGYVFFVSIFIDIVMGEDIVKILSFWQHLSGKRS
jgi:hypothetical protein